MILRMPVGVGLCIPSCPMPHPLITSDPAVMMGKSTISGTRITVEPVHEKLAAAESPEQIISARPRLTVEAIRAAIAFAAEVLRSDVVYPMEKVTG